MSAETIGNGVHEGRAFSHFKQSLLPARCISDRQGVETIHPFGMHRFAVDTAGNPGGEAEAHGLPYWLATHGIEVIETVEHERGVALVLFP